MSGESTETKSDQDNHDDKGGNTTVATPGSEVPVQENVPLASDVNTKIPETSESPGAPEGDLRQMVQRQVEYYFSRENLMSDHYLMTQMDRDQYVPVAVIAGFNQVKRLTMDTELVKEAIRSSDLVQLDETGSKVRANSKRLMLLVRGIPEGTSHEEVVGLFRDGDCPPSSRCEYARSDAWYIYFDSEEDAQKAYRFLREVVQEYKGSPLHVRLKEKVFQAPIAPPVAAFSNLSPRGPMPFQHPHAFPYMPRAPPMYVPNMMPWPPGGVYEPAAIQPFANGGFPNTGPPSSGAFPSSPTGLHPRFNPVPAGMSGRGGPFEGGRGHHHTPHQSGGPRGRHRQPFGGRDDSYGPHAGRGRRRDDDQRAQQHFYRTRPPQSFELAPNQFPPLPGPTPAEQVSMGLPAEEPGTNGRGSDGSKATYSQSVTKNNSTPGKPDVGPPVGESRQQQPGGVPPIEEPPLKTLSEGAEQKTVKAPPKESPNQPPPQQQQGTREGGARQAQGNPHSLRGNLSNLQPKSNNKTTWKSSGSDHRSSGSDHRSSGSDHRSSGSDHRSSGSDHRSSGSDHRSSGNDHRSSGGDHRSGGSDHRSSANDHRSSGGDHRSSGSDHRSSGADHRSSGSDHRPSGSDHRPSGSDHRSSGSDHRSSGGDHRSNEFRNHSRGRTKDKKPSKPSPRHSPKPSRHSVSAPSTPSAGTTPEKPKQEAPLPGPDTISYAAVTQRPKPHPKQGSTAVVENSAKDPSLAQSPAKLDTTQTWRPDKQTESPANTGPPANKQNEEECADEAGKSSPMKEESNPSVEQNH